MKSKILILLTLIIFGISGCTDDFQEINTNPNEPVEVPTSFLLTNVQRTIMDDMWDEWWNGRFGLLYSQYWSQVVYTDESRYNPRPNITNTYWSLFYTDMTDLQEIIRLNTDEATAGLAVVSGSNNNQIAVARILKAFVFQMMTDVWGDIPYTDALKGTEELSPAYTPQSEIYADLLIELTEAQDQIEPEAAGVEGDIIYGGDMEKWQKFGNSLRMRVAMRTSKVDASYASKVQAAIDAGAFESYEDDAQFVFDPSDPSFNPLYESYFVDNRTDFAVSEPLINALQTLNDPRLPIYADLPVEGTDYVGMPYGMDDDTATAVSGPSGSFVSLPNATNVIGASSPAFLMNYAEVCFIKSEINGWDQTEYENGVRASCRAWGVDEADIDTYIASLPAASEETVLTQKWLALYMQGLQGWFEWRRTGYPVLEGPFSGAFNDTGDRPIPSRLYYPSDEQLLNETEYNAAITRQGQDNLRTRVWWDTE